MSKLYDFSDNISGDVNRSVCFILYSEVSQNLEDLSKLTETIFSK